MVIEPALLSPISALLGALIGGGASLFAAVYTQRTQNRLQRVAGEVAKREAVYADFVMSASNLLLNAYVHDDIALGGDEQHLIGLINRMRLFAPPQVVERRGNSASIDRQDLARTEHRAPPACERSAVQELGTRSAPVFQPDLPRRLGQRLLSRQAGDGALAGLRLSIRRYAPKRFVDFD